MRWSSSRAGGARWSRSAGVALRVAAAGMLLGLLTSLRWPLRDLSTLDLSLAGDPGPTPIDLGARPPMGRVLVSVEYRVDGDAIAAFSAAALRLEAVRRRTGASSWGLFQDTERPACFVEQFLVRSWETHLRQHHVATAEDRAIEEDVWRFHRGDLPPPTWHLLLVSDGGAPPLAATGRDTDPGPQS